MKNRLLSAVVMVVKVTCCLTFLPHFLFLLPLLPYLPLFLFFPVHIIYLFFVSYFLQIALLKSRHVVAKVLVLLFVLNVGHIAKKSPAKTNLSLFFLPAILTGILRYRF